VSFALEIVGFFLFVGGFVYLILSGRLANMFRDRAPKPLMLLSLVVGIAFYHWGTILSTSDTSPATAPPQPRAEVSEPQPAPPVATKRPARAATLKAVPEPSSAPEPEHWQTIIVKEGTPEQVFVPQAKDPASDPPPAHSAPDPYESKSKRGIKAVGRFLHLRKSQG
jgi:hypothetical protein